MKAGYKIEQSIVKYPKFIIVSNYKGGQNLVAHYGYEDKKSYMQDKDENDIGFWRIKWKETIK